MKNISLGFSPCPNDTFIFHGLVHGKVESSVNFDEPLLEDVETLNSWALRSKLDVTKLSFHALGHVLDDYCVLAAGSALGRGCGPLLVSQSRLDLSQCEQLKIAIPGRYTTAAMLFRMYAPRCTSLVEMRFDNIIDSVKSGEVDGGVIIHESRFTYENEGLICLQDLGQWWEDSSGQAIPLGCIAARRSLGTDTIKEVERVIRESLKLAYENPRKCLPYVRKYSQEIDEKVVQNHISLYVNNYSIDLGAEGKRAVDVFLQKGRALNILPDNELAIYP